MKLLRVTLSPSVLRQMPEKERCLLLLMGHAQNEINTLTKLMLVAANPGNQQEPLLQAQVVQILTIVRTLIGKLYESWELLRKGYFSTKLSRVLEESVDDATRKGLGSLKTYFNKKSNMLGTIRNSFSFHYSLEHAALELPGDLSSEDLTIFLGSENGNSLYQFAEYLVGTVMLEAVEPGKREEALARIISETGQVSGWLSSVFQGLMISILKRHDAINEQQDEIDIGQVRSTEELSLNYFQSHLPGSNSLDKT